MSNYSCIFARIKRTMTNNATNDMIPVAEALGWLTRMANADGLLSPNEEELLVKFSRAYGLDEHEILEQARQTSSESRPEVELIDYATRNGREFEYHITSYLRGTDQLELLAWTGDKYHQGIYDPSNTNPDLHLRLHQTDGEHVDFYVECKWRHHWMKDEHGRNNWEIGQKQLRHYHYIAREKQQQIFVAFGIGRCGIQPRSVFFIPLSAFVDCRIFRTTAEAS